MNNYSYIRPPNIRVIKRSNITQRRTEWNSRFVLEKIPEYDSLKDKNCVNCAAGIGRVNKHRRIIASGNSRPTTTSNSHRAASNRNVIGMFKQARHKMDLYNPKILAALLDEIKFYWSQARTPQSIQLIYQDIYNKLPLEKSIPIISKEIDDLSKNASPLQRITKSVQAREQFLKNIIELENYLKETQIAFNNNELQREIFELFYNMRLLTINVVESIKKWKESFVYMSSFLPATAIFDMCSVDYCYGNLNYLKKLSSDLNFLYGSSLSRIISFSNRPDPFLLTPSIYKKKAYSTGRVDPQPIIVITLHPELKVRIQLCQRFINAELNSGNKSRTNDSQLQTMCINNFKKAEYNTTEDSLHKTEDHARSRSKMEINVEQVKSNPIEKEPDQISIAPFPTSNKQLCKDSNEIQVIEITSDEKNNIEEAEILEPIQHKDSEEKAVIWESKKDNFVTPDVITLNNGKNISDNNVIKQCGLFPIQLNITEFKRFYDDYMIDIDDRFKKSFEEYDDIKEMAQRGHESYFIQYNKSSNIGKPTGLLIMYGDASCQTHRRIVIAHISTKDMKDLVGFAHKIIIFIWENLPYKEIRIGLKHFLTNQNQLLTDPDISNVFINELKFRWKTLINNDSTKRITYYGLSKPEGSLAAREYPSNGFLFLRSYIILLLGENKNAANSNSSTVSKYSIIPYIHCLKELIQTASSCSLPDYIKSMLSTTIELKLSLPSVKYVSSPDINQIYQLLNPISSSISQVASKYCCAFMSIAVQWKAFSFLMHECHGIKYNYIQIRESLKFAQSKDDIVILIPTDDERITTFIILSNNIINAFQNSVEKGLEMIRVILKSETLITSSNYNQILLPGFNSQLNESVDILATGSISNNEAITSAYTATDTSLFCPEDHGFSLIPENNKENTFVVEEDFIFGLLHEKLEVIDAPMHVEIVRREKWVRYTLC